MKKLREQRKDLMESFTKEAIYKAVMEVVAEDGLQGITMSRVAQKAGIAKGTLYLYFKDKEDMIRTSVEAILEPMNKGIIDLLDGELPPDQKLKECVKFIITFSSKYRNTFRVMLYNQSIIQLHKERYMNSNYKIFLSKITSVIQEGIDNGLFRKLDASTLAIMFLESSNAITFKYLWLENGSDINALKRVDLFFDVFMNGILSQGK